MIRISAIQEALLHLVGWEQSFDPQQQIDAGLTETESGLTFQQAHPMVTLENILACLENESPEVHLDEDVRKAAERSIQNMVAIK